MSHDNVYGSAAMALLGKGRLGMPTKTQMKREIVSRSALSLLAAGIQFIEIPRTYPTFDNAFNHAFKKCGLDRVYPHVFGLVYSDPQDLIDNSITHTGYEIPFARWRREIHEGRRRYELYLTDDADQDRLERGDDPQSIVKEIISQDYGSDDASPFAVWPWTDFGKVMSNELIAILRCILSGAQNPSKVRAEGSVVCAEPDTLCSSMSLCACVGKSSLMGACAPYSAHRDCPSRSWRRSPTRTAGSRASSSWSPRNATARAPMASI